MDILHGPPPQPRERAAAAVQPPLTRAPDRAAVHGYAHMPALSLRQQMIPQAEERLGLPGTARELLLWDGYRASTSFPARGSAGRKTQAAGRLRRSFRGCSDAPRRC